MKTVLLHGLGQTAQDWKDVVCQLSVSNVECPELFSSMGNGISYSRILANLERQYSNTTEPLHICGLSLSMDETLVLGAVDLSGRPYCVCDLPFTVERVGGFDTEMVQEFFYAISYSAAMNLHLKLMHGSNNHHIMEAAFKAFAKALDEACSYDPRITDVLSTKGAL